MTCAVCSGSGRVPLPRGMSAGFYHFMVGCDRRDDGALLMVCARCDGTGEERETRAAGGEEAKLC